MSILASFKRSSKDILEIYDRQVDTVYRVCYSYMGSAAEAEDMTQETFLRLMTANQPFQNARHEKAWLIVTASNVCKDALKRMWRKEENIEDFPFLPADSTEPDNTVLEAVLALPAEYKDAVYMYYYEGYTTAEIARHCGCPEATVRSRLSRARKQLKKSLGGVKDER